MRTVEPRPLFGPVPLPAGLVHVWSADLDDPGFDDLVHGMHLSIDEQVRAARFRYERDRRRFTVARSLLRILLARYLNKAPAGIDFMYGKDGKPELRNHHDHDDFRFNISHAGPQALLAFTRGVDIGVDTENVRPVPELMEIARRYFSEREAAAVCGVPPEQRADRFFRCWTRKEAFIKANGEGLSRPLHSFDVTVAPEYPPIIERIDGDDPARWSLHHLEPAPGYLGAVALPRRQVTVELQVLHPDAAFVCGPRSPMPNPNPARP